MRKGGITTLHRRLNITLPEETVRLIDRATEKGDRSRLIDQAIRSYIGHQGKMNLRKRLIEGYRREAGRDLKIAEDWFAIDEEVWQN
ncbi:MAG: hypothetical protein Q8L47_03620 [bacterium]|nr:hypothetical protein [bacterium]